MWAERAPAFICALSLSVYWGAVVVKLVQLARRIGKDPNAMPRERVGQLMRVVWYPVIVLQVLHAWRIALNVHWGFAAIRPWIVPVIKPGMPGYGAWLAAAYLASAVVVVCTALTFVCWRKMGRSWRIGIDPNEKLELVSTGPYRYVRHPIYALRIVLNLAAIVAIPTAFMAVMSGLDVLLLQVEARREERYMEHKHGRVYADYKKTVGRFVPRGFVV